ETRPFTPHLTLLRLAPPVPAEFQALCATWSATPFGPLEVLELWLYESQPEHPGAGYRIRQRFPLAPAQHDSPN
ncbi:MAG: 2'-5' RNA ligase family protein, partial [Planctomycetaceae bacterium]